METNELLITVENFEEVLIIANSYIAVNTGNHRDFYKKEDIPINTNSRPILSILNYNECC